MSTVEAPGIQPDELAQVLQTADPRVRLVPARILRRVIRGAYGAGGFGRQVPHRGGFSTRSVVALEYATRDELGIGPNEHVAESLILLARPDHDDAATRVATLLTYWRELFHARVHLAFEDRADLFPADGEWVASRVEQIGRLEFAEARAVLYEDHYLALPADDRSTYVEFAAAYLELLVFHPERLPRTFPAIRDHDAIRELLARDIDYRDLTESTRPLGAPELPTTSIDEAPEERDHDEVDTLSAEPTKDAGRWGRLKARAEAASARGNNVRAAILRVRASHLAPANEAPRTRAEARSELDHLTRRLRAAIGFDAAEAALWRRALPAFLDRAAGGLWPREARLLYDLQKVCSDQEREIYAVDLAGWAVTLGRRPFKRLLPDQREILVLTHLRKAAIRLRRLPGPEPERGRLERLVDHAIHLKEAQIRARFRGRIGDALDQAGLRPANLPERVARRKLVEELLDLVVERGYLRIGDLRDALSRSQLKLHDLSGIGEFLRGDPLLQADAELARSLDGVYHRGEIYLRALQRGSSLAFGTKLGRAFTRLVAMPFGGAYIILEGLQHIVGPLLGWLMGARPELLNPLSFIAVGLLLLGAINLSSFRSAFFQTCGRIGHAFKAVFYSAPVWLLDRSLIRAILGSRAAYLAWNWIAKPLVTVWLLSLSVPFLDRSDTIGLGLRAVAFVLIGVFINSRHGRVVEEIAADGATRVGQRIWHDVLPNLFRWIMEFFKACLELFERLVYTVDEWLRFRGGEGRFSLASKGVVGLVWFAIAYLARIYINILIEPQINPIKHFPVVTVSHKIILPMSGTLFGILKTPLRPLGDGIANTIAGTTLFLIPGFFGFLVWELKENWRLYEANRSKTLRPEPIGHHGETMSRLLRRGFHSGTIPKLYAKLRRKDREAEAGAGLGPANKVAEAIRHNEAAVRHFVDRGVLYLLSESRSIGQTSPTTGRIEASTNRILVELCHGDFEPPAMVAFEESERRLHAHLIDPGWFTRLDDDARLALSTALAGLYATSDVERILTPTGSPPELDAPRVSWARWVEAWERDAAGEGHPPVIDEPDRILPPRSTAP
jgi:hypothetical protein